MKGNDLRRRFPSSILALLLALSLCLSSTGPLKVYAEETDAEPAAKEEAVLPEEAALVPADEAEVAADDVEEEAAEAAEELPVQAVAEKTVAAVSTSVAAANAADTEVGQVDARGAELVYGINDLPDEDAFVLMICGDGFTAEEQDKFYEEARKTAKYVMETSPWDEFKDVVKMYAVGTISKDSGVQGDTATTWEQANADIRDTYFGTRFWVGGMDRLCGVDDGEPTRAIQAKMDALKTAYGLPADFSVVIVNSSTYGGSGGAICVASLNTSSLEMMLHELGHTIAGLSDEYYAQGYEGEYANMTAESDPEKVPWSRFIGKNGVGVYKYDEVDYYRPHQSCKMRYLGAQYAFCEVCKEELRKSFCENSDVTKLYFQPYADKFYVGDETDMSQYFVIRRGSNVTTADQLTGDFQLTYYDADGNKLEGIPSEEGTYKMSASYGGDGTYGKCAVSQEFAEYEIVLKEEGITINIEDKEYDGEPAEYSWDIDPEIYGNDYTVEAKFNGAYSYNVGWYPETGSYTVLPPTKQGDYTMTLEVQDAEGVVIGRKSQDFSITFKKNYVVNNDDPEYDGAAVYYNNQCITIMGDGFTDEEMDEFEAQAQTVADYILNTEPFKELKLYFNFTAVETVSDESGIGSEERDTYFQTYYDENGTIVPNDAATARASSMSYYEYTPYRKGTIIIVNDKDGNVKQGAVASKAGNTNNVIYTSTDEESMAYAAEQLLSTLTSKEIGYVYPSAEEGRQALISALCYYWDWYFPVISSRAYDETIVETGEPIAMDSYFHTYIGGVEVEDVAYTMTYYADNNGEPGEALEGAPSEPGIYHVRAEIAEGELVQDGEAKYCAKSRGWTTYEIQAAAAENPAEPGNKDGNGNNGKGSGSGTASGTKKPASTANTVKTGDSAPLTMYIVLIAAAVLAVCAVVIVRKRRNSMK